MKATESLEEDHRIIEIMLPTVEWLGEQADLGALRKRDDATMTLDFLRKFVDEYHHGKEERHLFRRMEERGVARDRGLILELLKEHGQGRAHVRTMSEGSARALGGEEEAAKTFAQHARDYVTLLRHHIIKEDAKLWPLAEKALTGEDDAELARGYAQVERETLGDEGRNRYRLRAHELAGRAVQRIGS